MTETFLVIKPKDEKYFKIAELLKKFLYSPKYLENSSEDLYLDINEND